MDNITSINPYTSIIDLIKHSWSKYSNEIAIDNGVIKLTFQELEKRVTSLRFFFLLLREKGIYILDDLPCYITDAHTMADVQFTLAEVDKVVRLLVENEVVKGDLFLASEDWMSSDNPPFVGAKISIDENGSPVWVTSDEYKKSRNILLQSFFL